VILFIIIETQQYKTTVYNNNVTNDFERLKRLPVEENILACNITHCVSFKLISVEL